MCANPPEEILQRRSPKPPLDSMFSLGHTKTFQSFEKNSTFDALADVIAPIGEGEGVAFTGRRPGCGWAVSLSASRTFSNPSGFDGGG